MTDQVQAAREQVDQFTQHAEAKFTELGALIFCAGQTLRPAQLRALLADHAWFVGEVEQWREGNEQLRRVNASYVATIEEARAKLSALQGAAGAVFDCWGVGRLNLEALGGFIAEMGALIPSKAARAALDRTVPVEEGENANRIGAAEIQVGQYVYRRIESLMGAEADTADGRELDYLADLAANVEEYGARGDEDGQQWKSRHFSPAVPAQDVAGVEAEITAIIYAHMIPPAHEPGRKECKMAAVEILKRLSPSSQGVEALRPEVMAFAHLMEAKLKANDHKPGWRGDSPFDLLDRLREETEELSLAAHEMTDGEVVGHEAADVANFAMMIADICGALPIPSSQGEAG